jgi:hypothetical protein
MSYIENVIEKIAKEKNIGRLENAKIQTAGGAATGAVMGGLLGAGVGSVVIPAVLKAQTSNAFGRLGKSVTLGSKAKLGLIGAAYGAASGAVNNGISSGIFGGIVGSGVKRNATDKAYTIDQMKRKGLAGAAIGTLASMAVKRNPLVGAAIGGIGGGLSGLLNSTAGRKILRKMED